MSTPLRIAAFIAVALAVFGIAFGVGRGVGPLDVTPVAHDESAADANADVGGLQASSAGYTLVLTDDVLPPGPSRRLTFRVTRSNGEPLLDYATTHEKRLHLIVVRRDLTGFQHVHPELDRGTGLWSTEVALDPGVWRVFADFQPTGWDPLTLGADLSVPGQFTPEATGEESRTSSVDGYDVRLSGELTPGADRDLQLRVSRDGEPVTDLQPYLGAFGHLVALRSGDLGYLHVHPTSAAPGPVLTFGVEVPAAGIHRLFLDFRHDGVVHTASFTLRAGGSIDPHESADPADPHDSHEEEDDDGH